MLAEYDAHERFESIATALVEQVSGAGDNQILNLVFKVRFPVELLKTPQLLDVAAKADLWQSIERPPSLLFSHGEFIGDGGVAHLVGELVRKRDSNRALISLISQEHIVGSGDGPLPAFMTVQCSIVEDVLFVTVYFRALEVSKFFRINLEEIRLIIQKVYAARRDFKQVALTVIAFRAYVQENINTLERSELDRMGDMEILKMLEKRISDVPDLIREKTQYATHISAKPFEIMRDILGSPNLSSEISGALDKSRLVRLLTTIVDQSNELIVLRATSSHHADVQSQGSALVAAIELLAREFEV